MRRDYANWCKDLDMYDVTSLGHRDKPLLQTSWEEIGQEINVSWVVKENRRSIKERFDSERLPLVVVILNMPT